VVDSDERFAVRGSEAPARSSTDPQADLKPRPDSRSDCIHLFVCVGGEKARGNKWRE
jgi:hypothetical protein